MNRKPTTIIMLVIAMNGVMLGCTSNGPKIDVTAQGSSSSNLSSFSLGLFVPSTGSPTWNKVTVNMQRLDGNKAAVNQTFTTGDFQGGTSQNVSLKVAQGSYNVALNYAGANGTTLYTECASVHAKSYAINTAQFQAQIPVCAIGDSAPVGNVPVSQVPIIQSSASQGGGSQSTGSQSTGSQWNGGQGISSSQMSDVTIIPQIGPGTSTGGSQVGSQQNSGQGTYIATCSTGLSQSAAPNTSTSQYNQSGDLSQIPTLSTSASPAEIKQFIATVYSTFAVFPQIYETQLGLSQQQALAYMFADMSRESTGNTSGGLGWRIDMETGQGGPGDAWGPFQAAVTNFRGGGYDSSIEDYTGLPVPSMSQFKDASTSTYAGMKRLADGILNSIRTFGSGQPAQKYLLGSLADHNTGWPNSANDQGWLDGYGNEVLRLMIGYLQNSNLTNNQVYWTGESAGDWGCQ